MAAWQGNIKSNVIITSTGTLNLTGATYQRTLGAHRKATFFVNVTSIGAGDTWTIDLNWYPDSSSRKVNVATVVVTGTGQQEIALAAPFSSANRAIPEPIELVATLTVNGGTPSLGHAVEAVYS